MKTRFYIILFTLSFSHTISAKPIKIMLVTGGHWFETVQFFQIFDEMQEIKYDHFLQPDANKAIAQGVADKYDIVVFYDMWGEISEKGKKGYVDLTIKGKPLLFLHHSICSYQDWPEFEKILGGKYIQEAPSVPRDMVSTWKEGVWMNIEIVDPSHPVTRNITNFKIFDEAYNNLRVSKNITPLIRTNAAESSPVIGWEKMYNNSKIIYIELGHDRIAYENYNYRKLIQQSIIYLTKKAKLKR